MDTLVKTPLLDFEPHVLGALRKIYNLENGRMDQSIDILLNWAEKQEHFKNKKFERDYLERTIISCKGSVEKAKVQLEKICTYRTLLPDFFVCENISEHVAPLRDIVWINVIPKMTKDYNRIYITKINEKEFSSTKYMTFYRLNLITAEYMKRFDYVNGFIIIEDFRNLQISEVLSKINLIDFHRYVTILIEGFGARLASVHILSTSKLIESLLILVRPMLSDKINKRIHIHREIKELVDVIGEEYLPTEYGGVNYKAEELQKTWFDCITSKDHEHYLMKMHTYCTDESLRKNDHKYQYPDLTGISGSFRTLTVD